jgi:hypothetical protein
MPKEDRSRRLSQARRTVAIGLVVVLLCGGLALSPLLLGRGSLNRFIVAFALMGVFIGASFVLHGGWDWLRAGRSQ